MSFASAALAVRPGDGAQPAGAEPATAETVRQFVTFFLGSDRFAFPMERVREIIRMPQVVGVPLAPPDVLGLTNLRGAILPVRDLRTLLGLPLRSADDFSRTIVIDAGETVGLVVDRVSSVLNLPASQISAPDGAPVLGEALRQGILTGVARVSEGDALIQIIDPVAALLDALGSEAGPSPGIANSAVSGVPSGPPSGTEARPTSSRQIVCFELDGQEYAFDIADVAEIVRPPDALFRVPMTEGHVLGIMHLRNALLPILGLRRLLNLPDLPVSDTNRILVLRSEGKGRAGADVGIIVDLVREVLDVPETALVALGDVVGDDATAALGTMCRLDGGRRLIGLLSARTLLADPGVQAAVTQTTDGPDPAPHAGADRFPDPSSGLHPGGAAPHVPSEAAISPEETGIATQAADEESTTVSDEATDETQLVVFQLDGQEYGVEIAHVLEIIRIPPHVVGVPRAPAGVDGVINLRGSILPVIALRAVFGLSAASVNDRARIVVLKVSGNAIGYVVDSVTEVLRVPHAAFEVSPRHGGPEQRVIGTIARLNGGERLVQIVETTALPGAESAEAALETLAAGSGGGRILTASPQTSPGVVA